MRQLQRRLVQLGYWLGTPDGTYGGLTQQAVTAFQKVKGLPRDGLVGPATKEALEHAERPRGRTGGGKRVEIDKARQVVMEATGSYWKPVVRHEALFDRGEVKGLLRWAVAAVC